MDLHVRERRLPGIGHRYEIPLGRGQVLVVVVEDTGGREIGVLDRDADAPAVTLTLSHDQAMAVAALLTGARFALDTSDDDLVAADEVEVETVTIAEGSPAVDRPVSQIPLLPDSDAAVLAVIRDETPEVVEDEPDTPARPGDRLVVAARRDRIAEVVAHLAG